MLDDILELLDTPRQGLTNLARSAFGEADPLAGLPGGIGLLGSLLLGSTGVGLPLAMLGGSLMGGLAQAGGNASGMSEFKAPTAEEVATGMFGNDDFLSTLLAGALTDPLTYVGGIGGARAGSKIGQGVEDAIKVAGPGYEGRTALMQALDAADQRVAGGGIFTGSSAATGIRGLPETDLARIAQEIPPGSQYLGSGVERVALKTPDGAVVSVGPVPEVIGQGLPLDPNVIRPNRTLDLPSLTDKNFGYRVQRTPLADLKEDEFWTEAIGKGLPHDLTKIGGEMKGRGLSTMDIHRENIGMLGNNPVIIDPGSVYHTKDFKGSFSPVTLAGEDTTGPLTRLLGGRARLRSTLDGTRETLGLEPLLTRLGAGLGTSLAASPRTL